MPQNTPISSGIDFRADDLAELAGKIAAGRRVKGTAMNKTEAKQIVRRLRELSQ